MFYSHRMTAARAAACLLALLLLAGCTKSEDQRRFEREATTPPSNYTARNAQGHLVNEQEDPDDWRIGPMFSGILEVEISAFPNPVSPNQQVRILLQITTSTGMGSLSGLDVYAFRETFDNITTSLYYRSGSEIEPGLHTITLSADQFHRSGVGVSSLYRILIYDDSMQGNLITYGDVQVE
ncbi:MAG: hypothetical protein U5K31_03860 [Balneolaceae bacterium]|nr:hypothetical protein [Balneolaceae bacterium]